MDYLPKDPAILVSSVNMLLRDEEFDTLMDSFTTTSKNSSVRLDMTRKKRTNSESNHACMNCRVVSEEDEVNDNERQYRDSL